jgi:glucosamine--fructose-6-phosphate aminotransferase (isomerizing)
LSGLVGYIGHRSAAPIIIDALIRLEYRGYDSAGLAVIEGSSLKTTKTLGRPASLANKVRTAGYTGNTGIGHTRWASHGRPSIRNAHPQLAGSTAVVHNGILDRAQSIRKSLEKKKVQFRSETDSEILPHLINLNWSGSLLESVLAALKGLEGGLTCCVISSSDPDQLVAVRKGNPMVIGFGEGEYIAASDATAIAPHTQRMVFLRDGELAVLSHEGVRFYDFDGKPVDREPQKISWNPVMAEKRGYRHFLLKEIVESPRAVRETISTCFSSNEKSISPDEFRFPSELGGDFEKAVFCGSGSSYSAAMLGQWICESITGLSSSRQVASELEFGRRVVDSKTLYVAISQSGETLDTLEAARFALGQSAKVLAITNNPSSSLARSAHHAFITQAGPEISVASSKTFSAIVSALILLAFHIARSRKSLSAERRRKLINAIAELPEKMETMITYETFLRRLAEKFAHHRSFFFIGRGLLYPVADYAALMLKEVANIHGEALLGGEIKHGPISLIEKDTPIMFFANQEDPKRKILNDIDELRSRGARVIAIGFEGDSLMPNHCDDFIAVPKTEDALAPLLAIVPAQLFIYYVALYNKKDIDRPRNIAKSVTV